MLSVPQALPSVFSATPVLSDLDLSSSVSLCLLRNKSEDLLEIKDLAAPQRRRKIDCRSRVSSPAKPGPPGSDVYKRQVDASGNAYIGGNTVSTNFPVLNGFQTHSGGAANQNAQPVITTGDGFVAKFDTTGKLQYSSYLGGNADDAVKMCIRDS